MPERPKVVVIMADQMWTGRWSHAHGACVTETPMPAGERHAFRLPHHVLRGEERVLDEVSDALWKLGAAVAAGRCEV